MSERVNERETERQESNLNSFSRKHHFILLCFDLLLIKNPLILTVIASVFLFSHAAWETVQFIYA